MTLQDELENLVDRYHIEVILNKLATICHDKADHVLTNWQDKKLAKSWDKLGNKIQYASDTSTVSFQEEEQHND